MTDHRPPEQIPSQLPFVASSGLLLDESGDGERHDEMHESDRELFREPVAMYR